MEEQNLSRFFSFLLSECMDEGPSLRVIRTKIIEEEQKRQIQNAKK